MYQIISELEFILASNSPRRKDLLNELGMKFRIQAADIDETPLSDESPRELVMRLSHGKAEVIAGSNPSALVLGADTTVVLEGDILGKPADDREAQQMLTRLAGKEHLVLTAVTLLCLDRQIASTLIEESRVHISDLSKKEIEAYVRTGECLDKAGSYAVQGKGAAFIEKISGSYTNVVGLPVSRMLAELKRLRLLEIE